jgi:demethylmenaquinone methyltransferase/2-methoxy-6-polyprenyl-1,4-benzoquinol methylase
MTTKLQRLLERQKRYYQARAAEYDQWFYRQGRYDFGPEHTKQWESEAGLVRRKLLDFNLAGQVLEFAAGTGIWTQELLKMAGHVTALDSSAEVLEINRGKTQHDPAIDSSVTAGNRVTYVVADIFAWTPWQLYDAVFMGFWLSHIPPTKLSGFMTLVAQALKPGGKIFFVDSLPNPSSTARDMAPELMAHASGEQLSDEAAKMNRRLSDGLL